MASHKRSYYIVTNIMSADQLHVALDEYGTKEEMGVLELVKTASGNITGSLYVAKTTKSRKLNPEDGSMEEKSVPKDVIYPFTFDFVTVGDYVLLVVEASTAKISEHFEVLLNDLEINDEVPPEIIKFTYDLPHKVDDILHDNDVESICLKTARIGQFRTAQGVNDEAYVGGYSLKFKDVDTMDAITFLEDNGDSLKNVGVKVKSGLFGKDPTFKLMPDGQISWTCNDNDLGAAEKFAKKIIVGLLATTYIPPSHA